jgi:hypothetical protein
MYTGLVIEELLALVERAEQRAHGSRRPDSAPAGQPEVLLPTVWQLLEPNRILAGVA